MIKFSLIIFLSISSLTLITNAADTNEFLGLVCSNSDSSTSDNSFTSNLRNLLTSLAGKPPTQAAFFTAKSGELYGRVQCRADVPVADCASCIRNATESDHCPGSTNATVYQRWCLLQYANGSFFGVWDKSSMAWFNETDFEDPGVVTAGMNFMEELAATAAEQQLMFAMAELDAGEKGKRYGMAQCSRDIRRRDCGDCFESLLETVRSGTLGNKRGWEIYGSGCSMWYFDFQFYFDYTIPPPTNGTEPAPELEGDSPVDNFQPLMKNSGYGNFPPHMGLRGIIINGLVFYLLMLVN